MKFISEQLINNNCLSYYKNNNEKDIYENHIIEHLKNNIINELVEIYKFDVNIIEPTDKAFALAFEERDSEMLNLLMKLRVENKTKYIVKLNIK